MRETVKRFIDIVGAGLILLLSMPLLLLAAVAVKLTSRGPVVFGQERLGEGGRTFRCLKLRTMVRDAEEWLDRDPTLRKRHRGNGYKLPTSEDPRVTTVGRFLRFTHLDELPQLLNVLRGDMSLVGPRPIVEGELEWYGERTEELLSVKPGVFGPWTGQGKHRVDYPERVEVELSYLEKPSLGKDATIFLRNLPVIMSGQVENGDGRKDGSRTRSSDDPTPGSRPRPEREARS
jgi:lipopolysaccharide/colanic/teichoic acid biosynthesis glycosyltransferase